MLKFRPTKPVSSLQAKSFVKLCNSIDPNLIDRVEGWKWANGESGISEGKAKLAIKKLKRRKIEGADKLDSLYSTGPNNIPVWSAFDGDADIAPACPLSQLAFYINQIIDESKKESTPGFLLEMYYDHLNDHLRNIEKDIKEEFGWTAKDVQLAILTSICKQQRKLVAMERVIKRRNCLTDEEFNEEIGNDWLCNKIKEIDDDLLDQALPHLPTFATDYFS